MKGNINCAVKGSYKVDLKKDGQIVESTDWFDNVITNTGLTYPFTYSFAHCPMFLSLGTISSAATGATGISGAITSIPVYDPTTGYYNQSGQYLGWQYYEMGGAINSSSFTTLGTACGTKFTQQGLNFYRAWTIPSGAKENGAVVAGGGITIQTFMVSPSSPANGNTTGICAFSIVDRQVNIPSGYTATITYQLSLNFQNYTGFTFFSGISGAGTNGYFYTGNAATGTTGSEVSLLSGWSNLSGIYRLIIPGLQFVDGMGACVIPIWGDQMEPLYANCPDFSVYLSPDYSQFAVSQFGSGGISELSAYNSNGLPANYTQLVSAMGGDFDITSTQENLGFPSNPESYFNSGDSTSVGPASNSNITLPSDIHLGQDSASNPGYLLPINNYSGNPLTSFTYESKGFVSPLQSQVPIAFATPGSSSFDYVNYVNYGQKAIYSTPMRRLPCSGIPSSRSQSVTKKASFSPIQSMGYNSRYGSMTFGFNTTPGVSIGSLNFLPYVDFLFFDTYGRGADMPHYRLIPDIYLTNRGNGVGRIRFDITGSNGLNISSSNRFSAAYGFMGPGVDPTNPSTASGLDVLNNTLINSSPTTPSGYIFPGQVLNPSVAGNETYNGGTGWGAVYGVVASNGFYNYPFDTCLIDDKVWSGSNFIGFTGNNGTGVTPNPTGDYTLLYWPVKGSGLGLKISDIAYYSPMGTLVSDPTDYFAGGNYSIINDIQYEGVGYSGPSFTINLSPYIGTSYINIASNGLQQGTSLTTSQITSENGGGPLALSFFLNPSFTGNSNLISTSSNSLLVGSGNIFSGTVNNFSGILNHFTGLLYQYFTGIISGFNLMSGANPGAFLVGSGNYLSGISFYEIIGTGNNVYGTGSSPSTNFTGQNISGTWSNISGLISGAFTGSITAFHGTGSFFSGVMGDVGGYNGITVSANYLSGTFSGFNGTGASIVGQGNNINGTINNFSGQFIDYAAPSFNIPILTGALPDGTAIFSGFNASPTNLGYLANFTPSNFANYIGNPVVGLLSGNNLYLRINSGNIGAYLNISNYSQGGTGYTLVPSQLSQFIKPSGIIRHVENYNTNGTITGNRLLPNYAYPNNQQIDYYQPVTGGSYPGMSMQNGMDVFFTFGWSGA